MQFAIVTVPAAPVRRKPAHTSEMTSQLLFGESVRILKTNKTGWVKLRSLHDQYEGWLTANMLTRVHEKEPAATSEYVTTDLLGTISIQGKPMQIPFGSSLPGYTAGKGTLGDTTYEFSGNCINRIASTADAAAMIRFALEWQNVPYMWGGRSPLGADCSGFVQVICKMIGIDLKRDTRQQAKEGERVKKLKDSRPGDLAFFNDKEEIIHVGILLNNEKIIHAQGKVRIDTITKKGIINSDTGQLGRRLQLIKRLW
jgi:cell wall-associated NlpC family hydrolase